MPVFDSLEDKQVVITGGAGFIGSHLTENLIELGAHVTVVDNFSSGSKNNLSHLNSDRLVLIEHDASTVPPELSSMQPFLVLHFASLAGPPLYQAHPIETYSVNSFGTHAWLTWIRDNSPTTRFLYASTSEVYGDPSVSPQPESYWGNVNPNGPRACYDESKRFSEMVCGVFHEKFQLDTRIVRIFNTYGPRMNTIDGRVLPMFILRALDGKTLQVHGDGTQTRSFCFVSDLVEGILRLARLQDGSGETINLGNPDERSINQVAEQVKELLSAPGIEFTDKAKDDPSNRKPDISKAKQLLEWEPTVPFDQGLAETIKYFRSLSAA